MPLSLNEIRKRANAFSIEWAGASNEEADAKEFLIHFLDIFGITRRRVATFEHRVKKLDEGDGYIDLLWKGTLLVEMKSRGKDLAKAYQQAKDYCHGLKEHELPKMILVSDFQRFHVYDENGTKSEFTIDQLSANLHLFDLLRGLERRVIKEEDPVNLQAAELMGKLHDKLKDIGYDGHALELYLVRLLFLLFSDDTSIFERGIFQEYIDRKTNEDGADLAMHLHSLFGVLNTPPDKRLKTLDEHLMQFPYVNGKLFEENLPVAAFSSAMRRLLLQCCTLDWGKISPAIFGSLFQSVMDPTERRNLGAHYTSEKNILKVIQPLFMDELKAEHGNIRHDKNKLKKLHLRMSKLRFLDPACGCGNFLIIAYRELRLLEMDIVKDLLQGQTVTDIGSFFLLDVDQFYGIEYEEFPAQIALVAMWLMDHQMNLLASQTFGEYYVRLPLRKSATIVHGNALRIDWQSIIKTMPWDVDNVAFDFIMGNPPFLGKNFQNEEQRSDIEKVAGSEQSTMLLDYVTGWYFKSIQYIKGKSTKVAFVSTNSITQGEHAPIISKLIFNGKDAIIHFAYRTFKWTNEAKGNAAVHVVIIGFGFNEVSNKIIYNHLNDSFEIEGTKAKNINSYLIDGPNVSIQPRTTQLVAKSPRMVNGNKPTDGGNLLLNLEERNLLLGEYPDLGPYIRPFAMGDEFINKIDRFCLWLVDCPPQTIRKFPKVLARVEAVRKMRNESTDKQTRIASSRPNVFQAIRQNPLHNYLAIPRVSSERRVYIPIDFLNDTIAGDKLQLIENPTLFEFGILTSLMHMAWMKVTSGRLKSDFQYSAKHTYNTFPWPLSPTDKQKQAVEAAAQQVLSARAQFQNPPGGGKGASLADLYDPNTMPPVLTKAHQVLDKAVDLCYRPQPFSSETKRIEYLFDLYDQYTAGLFVKEKKGGGKK